MLRRSARQYREMSNSAKSLFVFAIYLILLGITVLVAPNALLTLFAHPATNEVWIRVVGMLLVVLAFDYIQAARKELRKFFQWTVYARGSVIFFFIAFVVLGLAKPIGKENRWPLTSRQPIVPETEEMTPGLPPSGSGW